MGTGKAGQRVTVKQRRWH